MFTLAGFFESSGATTLAYAAALADPHLRIAGDDIVVPRINKLAGVYAKSNSISDARLESPSLRRFLNLAIRPIRAGAASLQRDPENFWVDLFTTMIQLDESEALNLKIAETTAADAVYGLVWFADGVDPVPEGQVRTVRTTSATTLTANAWNNCALTFDEDLPAGRYAIIGASGMSAGMVAFRLVIPGGTWRPGTIGNRDITYPDMWSFRYGGKGLWAEFEHDLPPTVDVLSISADTAEYIWFDLVQVRAGRA